MKANLYDRPIARPACNRRRGLRFLASAAAPVLAVIAGPGSNAFGQTSYTWTTGSSNWSTPTNWNPNGVPGTVNGDSAYIDTSGATPVSVSYDYSGPSSTLTNLFVDYTGSATGGGNTLSISSNLSLNADDEYFGDNGSGTADQGNGSNTVESAVALGVGTGSAGTYVLSNGSLTDVAGIEAIGLEGNGTFNQSGGVNTEDLYNLYLGYGQGSNGTYTLSNGNLIDNGGNYPLTIGFEGNGTFIQSGGTNALTCFLTLGWMPGSNGTYTLSNGNLADNSTDPFEVGFEGTGTFIQSGGTAALACQLVVGDEEGSNGTFSLSNGTFTSASENGSIIGYEGNGTFTQSGGSFSVAADLDLGSYAPATGTYSISAGSATVGNDLNVGGAGATGAGTGVVNISGSGTLTVGSSVIVYNNPGNVLNLQGGELSTPSLNLNGNPSLLNWTAGTLNLTSSVTFDPSAAGTTTSAAFGSALTLTNQMALEVQGNETVGGGSPFTLNVGSGSSNIVTGTLTVSSNSVITAASGAVVQVGGDLVNASTQSTSVNLTQGKVQLLGGVPHNVFWPGVDIGATSAGYTNNFAIGTLELGSGDSMVLYGINGSGAIYLSTLLLDGYSGGSPATLIQDSILQSNSNEIVDMYYDPAQTGNAYLDDLTYALGNGGFLTPVGGSQIPQSLYWDNAGAPPPAANGVTWDSTNVNWNSGSSGATYADGDAVTFNDTNNGHYQVTLSTTVKPASILVSNAAGNYSITGSGTIIDTGSFIKKGADLLTLGVGLTASSLTITGGEIALATNTTLGSGSPLVASSNINISSLTITLGSVLDIANNHILIDYTGSDPIATIQQYLLNGFNGGHWNGTSGNGMGAIISSAAALNSHYGIGWADGGDGTHSVAGLLGGEIELKYTLLGDANLDGTVNGSDFSILAANFGLGHTNWDQGNFLYGSSVNGSDFSALAANFGQGDSGAAVAVSPTDIAALDAFAVANGLPLPTFAAVPEPASCILLSLGATSLLRAAAAPAAHRPDQRRAFFSGLLFYFLLLHFLAHCAGHWVQKVTVRNKLGKMGKLGYAVS